MLKCVACSCIVRDGRTLLLGHVVARRLSMAYTTTAKKNSSSLCSSSYRTLRILTHTPWFTEGHCRRELTGSLTCLALSRPSSRGDAASSSSVSPDGTSSSEGGQQEGQHFGALSSDVSSRSWYRKSSPDLQDAGYQDDDDHGVQAEAEEEAFRSCGRNTAYWYHLQCKRLIKENKLQEAMDVFHRDMLKVERLQPEEYNYSVLIGGCGRAGRLKNAFKLYNDMKKRGLVPSDATYTALFNACAMSPHKEAGLRRALHLEQELRRKNHALSTITYHALLKTHAMTNNLPACIHTIREMLQNGHTLTQETFHYLLMGCLGDKDAGFRMSLQVWRQMLISGIRPNTKNYNLLLRTARDCGIGEPALASDLLLSPLVCAAGGGTGTSTDTKSNAECGSVDFDLLEEQLFIQPSLHSNRSSAQQDDSLCGLDGAGTPALLLLPGAAPEEPGGRSSQPLPATMETTKPDHLPSSAPLDALRPVVPAAPLPNLLDILEGKDRGGVVSLGSTVAGPSDRLALIGGARGVLEKMAADGHPPDVKTLTLLADIMEPGGDGQSLRTLLQAAKQHQVKLDAGFFNCVIRRAARAGDLDSAKAALRPMKQRRISVDVQTYGCLALGCNTLQDAQQLLSDMELAELTPNVHVFSALIGRAAGRLDYVYLRELLKSMRHLQVWPNEVIIRQLEFAAQYPPNYDQYKSRNNYLVHIDGFRGYYQEWLRTMPAQSTESGPELEPTEEAAAEPQDVISQQAQPEAETVTVVQRRTVSQRSQQEAATSRFHLPKRIRRKSNS